MIESNAYTIDAEAWERELVAVIRDILDAEPVAAINRVNLLLDGPAGNDAEPIKTNH